MSQPGSQEPGLDARTALARRKLLGILSGTWLAQGVYALVKLGVPDLMAAGPVAVERLAADSGANPSALSRLLRALTLAGLFTQPEAGTFGLTATSDLLRSDVPGSVRLNALMQGEEVFRSFAEIMHTMRTGRPAFDEVYGTGFYQYLDQHPRAAATFHQSMGDERVPAALSTCDLGGARIVVDVGGGTGALLIELLHAEPERRGVLLDLPDALRQARKRLAAAGLTDRVECVEGSFFDGVPGGGDVYVLARVLHNWDDEQAAAILRRVRAAMPGTARLLVLEELLPSFGEAATARATDARTTAVRGAAVRGAAGMVDLLMLVTLEGRDRTESEYRALLVGAGFDVVATHRAPGSATDAALEARP